MEDGAAGGGLLLLVAAVLGVVADVRFRVYLVVTRAWIGCES